MSVISVMWWAHMTHALMTHVVGAHDSCPVTHVPSSYPLSTHPEHHSASSNLMMPS